MSMNSFPSSQVNSLVKLAVFTIIIFHSRCNFARHHLLQGTRQHRPGDFFLKKLLFFYFAALFVLKADYISITPPHFWRAWCKACSSLLKTVFWSSVPFSQREKSSLLKDALQKPMKFSQLELFFLYRLKAIWSKMANQSFILSFVLSRSTFYSSFWFTLQYFSSNTFWLQ